MKYLICDIVERGGREYFIPEEVSRTLSAARENHRFWSQIGYCDAAIVKWPARRPEMGRRLTKQELALCGGAVIDYSRSIDLPPSALDDRGSSQWMGAQALADMLDVTKGAVSMAYRRGARVCGLDIKQADIGDVSHAVGVSKYTRKVYRITVPREVAS